VRESLRVFKKSIMRKKQLNERIYIPYHVNPAVIKGYLSRLPKPQLAVHVRYMRMRVIKEEHGSPRRAMFIRLILYCYYLNDK